MVWRQVLFLSLSLFLCLILIIKSVNWHILSWHLNLYFHSYFWATSLETLNLKIKDYVLYKEILNNKQDMLTLYFCLASSLAWSPRPFFFFTNFGVYLKGKKFKSESLLLFKVENSKCIHRRWYKRNFCIMTCTLFCLVIVILRFVAFCLISPHP